MCLSVSSTCTVTICNGRPVEVLEAVDKASMAVFLPKDMDELQDNADSMTYQLWAVIMGNKKVDPEQKMLPQILTKCHRDTGRISLLQQHSMLP